MKLSDEQLEDFLLREQIEIAPIGKRFCAFFIDHLLLGVLLYIVFFQIIGSTDVGEKIIQEQTLAEYFQYIQSRMSDKILYFLIIILSYHTVFIWLYGATLGKIALKIQVVTINLLDSPNLQVSFLRAFLQLLSENLLYFILHVFAINDIFKRTLYDRVCKTIVICQKK